MKGTEFVLLSFIDVFYFGCCEDSAYSVKWDAPVFRSLYDELKGFGEVVMIDPK
jgi:hypothetical protein